MQRLLKKFLEVPKINGFPLNPANPTEESERSCFGEIIQKEIKTLDDAMVIYDKIKSFPCFQNFFSNSMRNFDENKILDLCKSFKYERFDMDQVVFLQGSASNDKVYVILSGEVAVINGKTLLGEFGDNDGQPEKRKTRAKKANAGPKILINSNDNVDSRRHTPNGESKKKVSMNSIRDTEKKSPSLNTLTRLSVKDLDAHSDRSTGRDDSITADRHLSSRSKNEAKKPEILLKKPTMTSGLKKMKAFVRMVATVNSMKKAATKKQNNDKVDSDRKDVGTLQYLDKEDEDNDEESEESGGEDNKEFEEYASQFGKIIRYLGKGENFGELALKRNALRSATILCKTECEFLVLEKAQYDLVFGKLQKEKEDFLRTVFPSLATNIASTDNFNYLVYFFKPQYYTKGRYIVKEGKIPVKDAKFYVIQQGECVLERQITHQLANPFNRSKALMSASEPVVVAKLGKGSLVGEEILETQSTYEYSVKAVSENVLVQAISRKDFKLRFPSDFRESIQNICTQKRIYREAAFEKAKAKTVSKDEQLKNENIYCLQNANMNDLISRSAAQGLSRQIQRDNNVQRNEDPIFKSIMSSPRLENIIRTTTDIMRTTIHCLDKSERRGSIEQVQKFVTPRVKSGSMEFDNLRPKSQDEKLYAKLAYLSKAPPAKKLTLEEANLGLLPFDKFVFNDKKARSTKQSFNLTPRAFQTPSKDSRPASQEKYTTTTASIIRSRLGLKDQSSDSTSLRFLQRTPSPIPDRVREICLSNNNNNTGAKTDRPSTRQTPNNLSEAPVFPSPRGISRSFKHAMKQKKQDTTSDYFFITAQKNKGPESMNTITDDTNELLNKITVKHSLSSVKKQSEEITKLNIRLSERRKTFTEQGLLSECLMYKPILTQRSSRNENKDTLQSLLREGNIAEKPVNRDDIMTQMKRTVKKVVVKNLRAERKENLLKGI